jgi:transcriptional regulator with GAF, ATPase, and Fis domain
MLLSTSLEWSGNVRQLERVVLRARERALTREPGAAEIVPEHFEARDLDGVAPTTAATTSDATPSEDLASTWQRLQGERARIDEAEQDVIRRAMADAGGVVAQAARLLRIARTTFGSRLDVLGIRGRTKNDG